MNQIYPSYPTTKSNSMFLDSRSNDSTRADLSLSICRLRRTTVPATIKISTYKMPRGLYLVDFFFCASLLCLIDSTVYKGGVQHDVPFSRLVAAGCAPCFEAPYGSASKSQDITSCSGPYLFVGTRIGDKQVLDIGALASVHVLRTEASRSAPYLSNGVYWHFMKGCSFGFMAVENNDTSINEEGSASTVFTSHEVSWSIDESIGCTSHDVPKMHSIVDTSSWTKHVHNCPGG